MRGLRLAASAVALTAIFATTDIARGAFFDFESTPPTFVSPPDTVRPGALTLLSLTDGGLTIDIYRVGGVAFDIVDNSAAFQGGKPPSWGARSLDPFFDPGPSAFIANFSIPVLDVSIEFGDYGADSDTMILEAYAGPDGTGPLVAVDVVVYGTAGFPTFATASVSGPPILSIKFIGGSSGFPNSVFYDNITATPVPEPTGLALLGMGLAGAAGYGYRRRHRVG